MDDYISRTASQNSIKLNLAHDVTLLLSKQSNQLAKFCYIYS